MRSGKKKMWTLRGFIVAVITLLLIIFAGVAVVGSAVIAGATRRQQESAYTSVLEMYSGNLEKELEQIDDFLLESIMIEGNARDILESTADLDRYLAEIRMKNSFEETTGHM